MKVAVTYFLEIGQYSPLKEREDGQGYESDYIHGDSFDEIAKLAKIRYENEPSSPFGEPLACSQMMLMDFEGEEDEELSVEGFINRLAIYDYNTLERQVQEMPMGFPGF
jgi:hypothetical protein